MLSEHISLLNIQNNSLAVPERRHFLKKKKNLVSIPSPRAHKLGNDLGNSHSNLLLLLIMLKFWKGAANYKMHFEYYINTSPIVSTLKRLK